MTRASSIMVLHYLGYFGSIVLVWLVMTFSLLKSQPMVQGIFSVLLLIASLLFGVVGLLYVVRGGRHGREG